MFSGRETQGKDNPPSAQFIDNKKAMPDATMLLHSSGRMMSMSFTKEASDSNCAVTGPSQALLHILRLRLDANKSGTAYEMAERLGEKSEHFKHEIPQMFLRANRFEPEPTAHQIISFFEMKCRLFGKAKLNKEIVMDDLNDGDKESLRSGSLQLLSLAKDNMRKRRRILLSLPGRRVLNSVENELRARFYLIMSALKLQDVQKDGLVMICYSIGQYKDSSHGFGYAENMRLLSSLPVQVPSIHICVDDLAHILIGSTTASSHLSPALGAKLKIHSGTEMECLISLTNCGIPQGCLPPATESDHPWMEAHLAWCNSLEIFDASTKVPLKYVIGSQSNAYVVRRPNAMPRELDVLFGSDHKSHPGNVKFHMLIDYLQDKYEAADRDGKVMISLVAVFSMKGTGSRFLDYNEVTQDWLEMQDTRARIKVTKIIRNRRRYKKRMQVSRS